MARWIGPLIIFVVLFSFSAAEFKQITDAKLTNTYVRAFARDNQRVYFGTTTGLYYLRKKDDKIIQVFPLGQLYITSIYPAGGNIIWVSTFEGVYKIDLTANEIVAKYAKAEGVTLDGVKIQGGLLG